MLKNLPLPLIALLLAFSLLTPSILPLLDKSYNMTIVVDSSEEEKNNGKEMKKKFDKKNLFLSHMALSNNTFSFNKMLGTIGYLAFNSDFKVEILLPPPELHLS